MMAFDRRGRLERLKALAGAYARVALAGITREYPVMPHFVATGPGPYATHRQTHPAFYGCFDWHSCVEMHWVVVRLLRLFPEAVPAGEARTILGELLTPANIAVERAFFADPNHRSLERPYGWGWLLTLAHELAIWDDPDGRRWGTAVQPLADLLATRLIEWLPKLTYPQRSGVHPNTAFSLSRAFDSALRRAEAGDDALRLAIEAAAGRWFATDRDYPAHYEPSGADFLSPALTEAELMSRLLPPDEFASWLATFLPGLSAGNPPALFEPATVSDGSDGQLAHLHGLNMSRAWALIAIAERLPAGDERTARLVAAAERHAAAALPHVAGSDYMVEHWLAAYATLLLSA